VDRWYRYRILLGCGDPERNRYVHVCGRPLDVRAMHEAAQCLVGTHDFLSLSEEITSGANTVRTVLSAQVQQVRDEVRIDVVGEAFLRGMMRRIAGAILEVGLGSKQSDDLISLLRSPRIGPWPVVLPAKGLTLMRVRYGRTLRDIRDERQTELRNERGLNDDPQLDE
jgi:tRNA pseudouridine38-40 synthase